MNNSNNLNQDSLALVEEFSESLIDIIPGIFAIMNSEGKFLKWNKKFEDDLGYNADEISTMSPMDFFDDDTKLLIADKIKVAFETGHAEVEEALVCKTGNKRYYHVIANSLQYKGQQCLTAVGVDISEKRIFQTELKEREQRYNAALNGIDAGVWDFDFETQLVYLSPKYLEIVKREGEDSIVTLDRLATWMVPEDFAKSETVFADYMSGKTPAFSLEVRFVMPDGNPHWFSYSGKITYDENGPVRMVGSLIDIHDKKTAESALVEREQRYNQALHGIGAGVWDLFDIENMQFYLSPKYLELIGRTYEERPYTLTEIQSWIHPDDFTLISEGFNFNLANSTPAFTAEARYILPTGSKKWFSFNGILIYDENNKPVRAVGSIIDIHPRKQAEERLSMSLKELSDYKIALDESSIVAITDQKGIINYVNDNFCRISKYSRQELIGKDHRVINSGYHTKEFIRNLWVTIANGKIWRGDLCNRAKDGSIYWVETTIVPFLTEQGKPWQYVAIRSDITGRKLVEEEQKKMTGDIVQRNKDLEQFAYIVSHNLRAPVANILGFTDVLKQTGFTEEQKLEFVEKMSISVIKLDDVIRDLNHILQVKR